LAQARSRRLKNLLKKNCERTTNQQESAELDELLAKSDQIALLKARAEYNLQKI